MTRVFIAVLVAVTVLSACTTVMVPYNQSQDELRASIEKFGGKQTVAMRIETLVNNIFLTTKHCTEYPLYTVSPDKNSVTATAMFVGWTAPAYQVVIDVMSVGDGIEISYWGQNEMWRKRAASWIDQMKNPEICRSK